MIDTKLAPYATTLLRLSLGVMVFAHGLLKIVVFTPAGTAAYFASIGLPEWLAYATIVLELGGGIALLAGVFTRYVSLALIPVLIGSVAFAHWDAGWLFSNEGGGWEYPAFWAVALAVQAMLGDGAFALQRHAFRQHAVSLRAQA